MRDYFGEYLASRKRLGQSEEVPAVASAKTPLQTHILWGLLVAAGAFGAWKISKLHSKFSEAVSTFKKTGSRKND